MHRSSLSRRASVVSRRARGIDESIQQEGDRQRWRAATQFKLTVLCLTKEFLMSTDTVSKTVRQYEGMFLFPQAVTADLTAASDHVRDSITRHGGEVVSLVKWDERRLAFDIAGNKRGVYFLAYFTAPTSSIASIERDCNLSERMLRAMIVKADHLSTEQMQDAEGQARLLMESKLRRQTADAVEGEGEAPPPVMD
ncbi:MAG: 30S ribosomal protein S6 [Phycisphaerales bacterium]|nr:30S ribosomal protein S6 [Phycisphaerales bacterium]